MRLYDARKMLSPIPELFPDPLFVDVDGIRTRYYDEGVGPVVLLLHGGDFRSYATADDWSLNIGPLSSGHRVIALDKLGQGRTQNPSSRGDYTLSATTAHISAFVHALDLRDLTVVGHSRGALPAAVLALDEPRRVRGLVVIDSNTLPPDDPVVPSDFYAGIYASRPDVADEAFVRREPEKNSYSIGHVSDDFVARRLEIALLSKMEESTRIIVETFSEGFHPDHERLRSETLRRISTGELRASTRMIWGHNDPSAPVLLAGILFEIFAAVDPSAILHILNESGHYPYRERPAECNKLIADFVDGVAVDPETLP